MCYFSIIIPAYNVGKYLNKCIDSILKQTYTDFEVIIIDDASDDNTGEIALEYSQKYKFIKFSSISRQPVGYVRNQAIKKASGKYIVFIDADDSIEPDFLKQGHESLKNQDFDICFLPNHYMDDSSGRHEINLIHDTTNSENAFASPCLFIDYLIGLKSTIPSSMWTIICSRKLIMDNNIVMNPEYLWSEDSDFIYNVLSRSQDIAICWYRGYIWNRLNMASATRSIDSDKVVSRLNVYKKWINKLDEDCFGKLTDPAKSYIKRMMARNYCEIINVFPFIWNRQVRKTIEKKFKNDGIYIQYSDFIPDIYKKYGFKLGRVLFLVNHYIAKVQRKIFLEK